MAVVGTEILNKFLGSTEAEKAFEPWWDTTEDFLVYGLILLGKFRNITRNLTLEMKLFQMNLNRTIP